MIDEFIELKEVMLDANHKIILSRDVLVRVSDIVAIYGNEDNKERHENMAYIKVHLKGGGITNVKNSFAKLSRKLTNQTK